MKRINKKCDFHLTTNCVHFSLPTVGYNKSIISDKLPRLVYHPIFGRRICIRHNLSLPSGNRRWYYTSGIINFNPICALGFLDFLLLLPDPYHPYPIEGYRMLQLRLLQNRKQLPKLHPQSHFFSNC